MNKYYQEQFMYLVGQLSPENLHCDGEISHAEANRKHRALRKTWSALETQVGRKVTEYEIIGNHFGKTYA